MASIIRGNDNFDSSDVGPSTTLAAVGTYAFLKTVVEAAHAPGSTQPASNLNYSNAQGNTNSSSYPLTSGTWRCMGFSHQSGNQYSTTLWVRIS